MTINLADNDPRNEYTVSDGNSQTVFTMDFEIFDNADLNVYVDGTLQTLTTHYKISDSNSDANAGHTSGTDGFVHFTSAVTASGADKKIVLTRSIVLQRTTDFPSAGPFDVGSLNTELDRITAIQADLKDDIDRSLRLTDFDLDATLTLPAVDTRKGKTLAFNASSGAVEAGPSITDVQTVSAASADIATLANIQDGTTATNAITTVSGINANVTTVAGIAGNVTTVAGMQSNIAATVADATDIGTVASNISHITSVAAKSSLITSDFVSDLNALAVSDVINDINTLATSDIVSDLNTLATSDIVSDLNTLATSDIVSDINTLATSDIVTDLNLLATSDFVSDLNTMATSSNVSDLNTVAGAITNINTTATNISGVNSFAERYRVGSSDPTSSLDAGDLFYNTSSNLLKRYNGSAWIAIASGLTSIAGDSNPALGGNLDVNGNSIVSVSNGNISITPNGSGKVILDGLSHPTADGSAGQFLKTDGGGNLSFDTVTTDLSGDSSPQLGGNLDVVTHSIVSTSNRDITINPNGTGNVLIGNYEFDADQSVGSGQDNYVLTYDNSTGHVSLEAAAAAGGATGGGSDEIFYENGQNVTTNYTITNGKNAMSAGPITINSSVTVTVGSGETWTVV